MISDHASVIDVGVLPDLGAGGGDILGGRGEAGAVVCAVQVVINCLGHAHDAALIAYLLHILRNLIAGIHRVIAAIVEEVADVVLLENLKDPLVISVILVGVSQLVAAGAQSGRGGIL